MDVSGCDREDSIRSELNPNKLVGLGFDDFKWIQESKSRVPAVSYHQLVTWVLGSGRVVEEGQRPDSSPLGIPVLGSGAGVFSITRELKY